MATQHDWLDYASAIGSVIGIITGLVGLGFAIAAFRRTKDLKVLDLRVELKKADACLRLSGKELPDLIGRADQSHQHSLAADGLGLSGAWELWKRQVEEDTKRTQEILALLPADVKSYANLEAGALENQLIASHALQLRIDRLTEKYAKTLADDHDAVKQRTDHVQQLVAADRARPR